MMSGRRDYSKYDVSKSSMNEDEVKAYIFNTGYDNDMFGEQLSEF